MSHLTVLAIHIFVLWDIGVTFVLLRTAFGAMIIDMYVSYDDSYVCVCVYKM